MSEFLSLVVKLCKIIAAETEILRLSVKPTIGILIVASASFKISSDKPSFSVPKKRAAGFKISNLPATENLYADWWQQFDILLPLNFSHNLW